MFSFLPFNILFEFCILIIAQIRNNVSFETTEIEDLKANS